MVRSSASNKKGGDRSPPLKCALIRMAEALQGRESFINPLWRGECVFLGGTREPPFFASSDQVVVMATLCCHPSRHPIGGPFSVKGGDASNAGCLGNTPTFLAVCKKCSQRFLRAGDPGHGPPGSMHSYPDWAAFPAAFFIAHGRPNQERSSPRPNAKGEVSQEVITTQNWLAK